MTASSFPARRPSPLGVELDEDLQSIAAESGCELIHTELRGDQLRLVLDHPDGVTIDHCSDFSRQASALLDVEDFGSSRYVLEVSSPGLDRELYDRRDYERFVDHRVRVRFDDAQTGAKRTVVGRLQAFDDEAGGRIRLIESGREAQEEEPLIVALEQVETARLEIEP